MATLTIERNKANNLKTYRYKSTRYKLKNRRWLKYLITTAVLAAITVFIAWLRGAFEETSQKALFSKLSDAFCIPGILAIFDGLLVACKIFMNKGGWLEKIFHAIKRFFLLFKEDSVDRKYRNFNNYKKALRDEKQTIWFLFIVGAVYLGVGIALLYAVHM